jgi:hypothetical protein
MSVFIRFGLSLNSVTSREMQRFAQALRPTFKMPSAGALQRVQSEMYSGLVAGVEARLRAWGRCALAVDAWEDKAHNSVVAFTAHGMRGGGRPLVVAIERLVERHTADNLQVVMEKVVAYVEALQCKVVAIATDNAENFKNAASAVKGVLSLPCLAHAANLLLKNVYDLWPQLTHKAGTVVDFFRAGYTHQVYVEAMKANDGTLLRRPGDTRWGSKVDMLYSLICNRTSVEHALGTGPEW